MNKSGTEDNFSLKIDTFSQTLKIYDDTKYIAIASVKYDIWLRPIATIVILVDKEIVTIHNKRKVTEKS